VSWKIAKLNEICRPRQWRTISASQLLTNGYTVYGANGKIGFYSEFTHENPTLMITCRGATCGNVNISEPKSYINGNAMALDELDESSVYIKYLYYFLLKRGFSDVISGSAQPQITGQGLEKIEIPLPTLSEQKRIAAILDKADSLRRKNQQAIELADKFLKAVFLDMFGDPLRWDKQKIQHGWRELPIREIANLKRGYDLPVQARNVGNVPIYAANGVVGFHDVQKVKGPGVITGRSGTLGTVMYSDGSFWPLNTSLYVTDFCGNEPRYVQWFLKYLQLDRYHRGAGVPTLNRNLFLDELSFIPPLKIQTEFVSIYNKVTETVSKLSLCEKNELFTSLSQKALSGGL
jgi:type I restriction enzyme S subunit